MNLGKGGQKELRGKKNQSEWFEMFSEKAVPFNAWN